MKSKVSITIEADERSRSQHQQGIIQLHEEHQSFLLTKQFDWENAVTFTFKNQTRLVNSVIGTLMKCFFLNSKITLD